MKLPSTLRLLLGAAVLSLAACQSTNTGSPQFKSAMTGKTTSGNFSRTSAGEALDPSWRTPPKDAFRLGPGDVMDIEVIGDGTTRATATVSADGRLYYYLLPGQKVAGLTLAETKALLDKELLTYIRKPDVSINLRTVASQRVWVLGRLNNPGIYPLAAPMTVLEAISKAGGLFTSRFSGTTEELADLHHSMLIRNGKPLAVDFNRLLREGDMSQNIYLRPNDYIYLPSALSKEVQILGAVKTPKAIGFMDQVTLVSAITNAGGPIEGAQLTHIAVVRGSLTQPEIAIADFNAIATGKQPDMKLEPGDIVYVPNSPYTSLAKYAGMVVETFARTVSANEGGNAVNGSSTPVSVNVGLQ
jgi:protein involved in polysaccharide export with SLBB domain